MPSAASKLMAQSGKSPAPSQFAPPSMTWEGLRQKVGALARQRKEWAGMPLPVFEAPLVIAPKYPQARMNGACLTPQPPDEPLDCKPINEWHSERRQGTVWVVEEKDGRRTSAFLTDRPGERAGKLLSCLGISMTFDMAAEEKAMSKLATLIKPHLFDCYKMTGCFVETGRSGIGYILRRLKPTIATREGRVLCSLCLHPIGHYQGTPFGVMVPTDDVIAHLVMLRGDEHFFWRKANQHGIFSPGFGV